MNGPNFPAVLRDIRDAEFDEAYDAAIAHQLAEDERIERRREIQAEELACDRADQRRARERGVEE